MNTKIIHCNCNNKYQDTKYGKNKRVANKTTKHTVDYTVYRCTVCAKEHSV